MREMGICGRTLVARAHGREAAREPLSVGHRVGSRTNCDGLRDDICRVQGAGASSEAGQSGRADAREGGSGEAREENEATKEHSSVWGIEDVVLVSGRWREAGYADGKVEGGGKGGGECRAVDAVYIYAAGMAGDSADASNDG